METWTNRWNRVDISIIGKVLRISGVLAAILNFLLIWMSGVSGNCTILCHTLEDIGFAVGIASISQFWAKLQVLLVYAGFLAAILKILIMSMSRISADCTIVFSTVEIIDLAIRIVSISQFLANLQAYPVYSSCYGRHLEFSANIDIAH